MVETQLAVLPQGLAAETELATLRQMLAAQQVEIDRLGRISAHLVESSSKLRRCHASLSVQHHSLCDSLDKKGLVPRSLALECLQTQREACLLCRLLTEPAAARAVASAVASAALFAASRSCMESLAAPLSELAAASASTRGSILALPPLLSCGFLAPQQSRREPDEGRPAEAEEQAEQLGREAEERRQAPQAEEQQEGPSRGPEEEGPRQAAPQARATPELVEPEKEQGLGRDGREPGSPAKAASEAVGAESEALRAQSTAEGQDPELTEAEKRRQERRARKERNERREREKRQLEDVLAAQRLKAEVQLDADRARVAERAGRQQRAVEAPQPVLLPLVEALPVEEEGWAEITVEDVFAEALLLSWPGLKETAVASYSIEARPACLAGAKTWDFQDLLDPQALLHGLPEATSLEVRAVAFLGLPGGPAERRTLGPWLQVRTFELDLDVPNIDVDPEGNVRGGCEKSGCRGYMSTEAQDPCTETESLPLCARCGLIFNEHSCPTAEEAPETSPEAPAAATEAPAQATAPVQIPPPPSPADEEEAPAVAGADEEAPAALLPDARDALPRPCYWIAGTWSDFQKEEMRWNGQERRYEREVEIGRGGEESFQLLLNGRWDKCYYPSLKDACPHVRYEIRGPDGRGNEWNWTIGKHVKEAGEEGDEYRIRLFLADDGSPKLVDWEPLHSSTDKPTMPQAAPRVPVDLSRESRLEQKVRWASLTEDLYTLYHRTAEADVQRQAATVASQLPPLDAPPPELEACLAPARQQLAHRVDRSLGEYDAAKSFPRKEDELHAQREGYEMHLLGEGLYKLREIIATRCNHGSFEQVWRIVGGQEKGGIIVRVGSDTDSLKENERLSTGALVEQVSLVKDRLHYRLLAGTGPQSGWVATKIKVNGEDRTMARRAVPGEAPDLPAALGQPEPLEQARQRQEQEGRLQQHRREQQRREAAVRERQLAWDTALQKIKEAAEEKQEEAHADEVARVQDCLQEALQKAVAAVERLGQRCASKGCSFCVHDQEALGEYCCLPCEIGVGHDAACQRVLWCSAEELEAPRQPRVAGPQRATEPQLESIYILGLMAAHIRTAGRLQRFRHVLNSIQKQELPGREAEFIFSVSWSSSEEFGASVQTTVEDVLAFAERTEQASGVSMVAVRQHEKHSQFQHLQAALALAEETLRPRLLAEPTAGARHSVWVIFGDDDDIWHRQRVAEYVRAMRAHPTLDGVAIFVTVARANCQYDKRLSDRDLPFEDTKIEQFLRSGKGTRMDKTDFCVDWRKRVKAEGGRACFLQVPDELTLEYFDFCPRLRVLREFFDTTSPDLLPHRYCDLRFNEFLRLYPYKGREVGLEVSFFFPECWMLFYATPVPEDQQVINNIERAGEAGVDINNGHMSTNYEVEPADSELATRVLEDFQQYDRSMMHARLARYWAAFRNSVEVYIVRHAGEKIDQRLFDLIVYISLHASFFGFCDKLARLPDARAAAGYRMMEYIGQGYAKAVGRKLKVRVLWHKPNVFLEPLMDDGAAAEDVEAYTPQGPHGFGLHGHAGLSGPGFHHGPGGRGIPGHQLPGLGLGSQGLGRGAGRGTPGGLGGLQPAHGFGRGGFSMGGSLGGGFGSGLGGGLNGPGMHGYGQFGNKPSFQPQQFTNLPGMSKPFGPKKPFPVYK